MRVLRIGSTGNDVTAWENFLTGMGYYTGEVNGKFDNATADATKQFQGAQGIGQDGQVGPVTWSKALAAGFPGVTDDSTDEDGPNWPPPPSFGPLYGDARDAALGKMNYRAAGTTSNPEAIEILGSWVEDNIVTVEVPQLIGIKGAPTSCKIQMHQLMAPKIQAVFAAWADAGLLDRILTWDGGWAPRFVRGSRTSLSNHAMGAAFDINAQWNWLGAVPALKGKQGSARELVTIANQNGLWWGGHFATLGGVNKSRIDGMHFELAIL
jgi:hypothetical protein